MSSGHITEINNRIKNYLGTIVEINRIVPILLKNVLVHSSKSCLIFFKFVMGVGCVEFC